VKRLTQVVSWTMVVVMVFMQMFLAGCGGGTEMPQESNGMENASVEDSSTLSTTTNDQNIEPQKVSIDLDIATSSNPDSKEITQARFITKDGTEMTTDELKKYLLGYNTTGIVEINFNVFGSKVGATKDATMPAITATPIAEIKIQMTNNSWIKIGGNINKYIFGKILYVSNKNSSDKTSCKFYVGYFKGSNDLTILYEENENYFIQDSFSSLIQTTSHPTKLQRGSDEIKIAALPFVVVTILTAGVDLVFTAIVTGIALIILGVGYLIDDIARSDKTFANYDPPKYCPPPDKIIKRLNSESSSIVPIASPSIVNPPTLEPGVEEVGRSSNLPWQITEWKGRLIGIHVGKDGKIYLVERGDDGKWNEWKCLPDSWTNSSASISSWLNHLVVAFRGGDGKIWIGILWNGEDWSGWRWTGRHSKFAPSLASDGKNVWLIHSGATNNRIYWSADYPWFQTVEKWIDSGRDTDTRPSACAYDGQLWIIQSGGKEKKGYFKNVTKDSSPAGWQETWRNSPDAFSMTVIDGIPFGVHSGMDRKVYAGELGGSNWPPCKERTNSAPFMGLYKGRAGIAYLNQGYMRFQWVDSLVSYPTIESGVDDLNRKSRVAACFVECHGEMITGHVGYADGKIYLLRKNENGWYVWRILPDAYTEDAISLGVLGDNIIVSFRAADSKIWVGMLEDGYNWTGWRFTGRTSTHAPTLLSDGGKQAALIHKGMGNDKIYLSLNAPYFNNDWTELVRTTKTRPNGMIFDGHVNIIQNGSGDNAGYFADITTDPLKWINFNRYSYLPFSICGLNGQKWIAHKGLNDSKNYIGIFGQNNYSALKEKTTAEPFIGVFQGKIGYLYNNQGYLRLQWIK